MRSRRAWIGLWAAVSGLWIMYWIGLTASMGAEAIRDLVTQLPALVMVGALCLFLPVGLYAIGNLVAWINGGSRGRS
jgi:hypothetical protein